MSTDIEEAEISKRQKFDFANVFALSLWSALRVVLYTRVTLSELYRHASALHDGANIFWNFWCWQMMHYNGIKWNMHRINTGDPTQNGIVTIFPLQQWMKYFGAHIDRRGDCIIVGFYGQATAYLCMRACNTTIDYWSLHRRAHMQKIQRNERAVCTCAVDVST